MASTGTIFVAGITGQQGGAVLNALEETSLQSKISISIKGLTRDAKSATSNKLSERGVTMIQGNLLDKSSLLQGLKGVNRAFLVTQFMGKGGVEAEVIQGKTFIDAAKQAGVKYIVFSSVGSADSAASVPHFHSKFLIEDHLKASGMDWAIVRPASFMDSVPLSGFGQNMVLSVFGALVDIRKQQWVAVSDIGRVAASCLLNPEQYKGKTIELSGDELTLAQLQDSLGRATGKRPWRIWMPQSLLELVAGHDFRSMARHLRSHGYQADVPSLRKTFPGLQNWEMWARNEISKNNKTA